MTEKQRKNLIRILVAAALMVALSWAPIAGIPRMLAYLVPYLIAGYDVLWKAWKGIRNRNGFDESLLMAIATLGAIVLAVYEDGDYGEAIAVMVFYQLGEWFQSYAVGRSRRDISDLMDIRPDFAHVEGEDGTLETVDPDEVEVGSTILVKPGEKIPIDGIILSGAGTLDTRAITGESLPREARAGDEVLSGCINQTGVIRIRTTKEFEDSTASKILELVEDAGARKAKSEVFITRFARIYTPIVVYAAIALALLPPLVQGFILGTEMTWGTWIYRALTFLIISCPCALVISIPLSFFAGLGAASRQGVLVKGSNFLETLADAKTIVFDKTGTLTKGVFEVTAVHPEELDERELLHLAAHVEHFSTHPIAASLREAYQKADGDGCAVGDVEEIAGQGVIAWVAGRRVAVGNAKLMDRVGARWHPCDHVGTIVHVAIEGKYAGHVVIADEAKETARIAIESLKANGVRKTVMLTGDQKDVAEDMAKRLGVDAVYSELLPQDKVEKVEKLLTEMRGTRGTLAFVGDGINDAPVLSRADVGIAMGAMGSDAAIEAADIVLMDDDPAKISVAQHIARHTLAIVRQNIVGAIGIKVLVLLLGALGYASMWAAVFADVGVTVLAVLNAMRILLVKKNISSRKEREMDMKKSYKIEVDCANCASLMEEAARKTEGVKSAVVNFMALKMKVEFEEGADPKEVMPRVRANCKKVEDDCEVYL